MHRLGRPTRTASTSTPVKPPPVLIQLTSRKIKSNILSKRRMLKDKSVVLTEHLTSKKSQLLKKVNELVQHKNLDSAWVHEGKILVKTSDNHTVTITNSNVNQYT